MISPLFFLKGVPHFKEHKREVFNSRTLEHKASVLPVTEAFFLIYILIAYIYAAYKAYLPVDDGYLSVVAVIHHDADNGHELVKRHGLDAVAAQCLIVV